MTTPDSSRSSNATHSSRGSEQTARPDIGFDALSMEDVRRLTATELSLRAKLGHVALLLAALTMAGVTGALAATEPSIPVRTRVALTVMSAIGVSWAVYAVWTLSRRYPLLARHSVIASRMAVLYSGAFAVSAAAALLLSPSPGATALAALGTSVVMLVMAGGLLLRARQRVRMLAMRRDRLEARLAGC